MSSVGEVTVPEDDKELERMIIGLLPPPPNPERTMRGQAVGLKAARAQLLKSNFLDKVPGKEEWGCIVCREDKKSRAW
jgi:hypothetical protein